MIARCLDLSDVPARCVATKTPGWSARPAIVRGSSDNTKRFHNPALGSSEGAAAYVEREFQPDKVKQRCIGFTNTTH
jgi:salicylate hydroxylase